MYYDAQYALNIRSIYAQYIDIQHNDIQSNNIQ